MKFKVGDKVKVVRCNIKGNDCRNLNKVFIIKKIENSGVPYPYILDGTSEVFKENELELVEKQFTKSDLKDYDIVTERNGKKRIVLEGFLHDDIGDVSLTYFSEDLKDEDGVKENDIVKVERPTQYETVFERKEEILDEVEKRYLANVIRPFRKRVQSIAKHYYMENEHIILFIKGSPNIMLPFFAEGTMYKGMELNKEYRLKKLGL